VKDIRIHLALRKEVRQRPKEERLAIGKRIADAQRLMGEPHLRKGAGLRKLRNDYFEVRVGLKERLVFENTETALVFELIGNHEDVKRFLKSH
jgi:DNA-binding helix-hairpin-helix protein with protein kinase domain